MTSTSPVRTLALAPTPAARGGWLGLALSILCFIHCVGAAALVPLLPAAAAAVSENELLEWGSVVVSCLLAGRLCWSHRGAGRPIAGSVWAAVTAVGSLALFVDSEDLLQLSLATLALLQLSLLVARHRRRRH